MLGGSLSKAVHRRLPCLLHAQLESPVFSVLSNCSAAGFVPSSLTSLLQSCAAGGLTIGKGAWLLDTRC